MHFVNISMLLWFYTFYTFDAPIDLDVQKCPLNQPWCHKYTFMELIKVVLNDKCTQFEHSNDMQQYNILKQIHVLY